MQQLHLRWTCYRCRGPRKNIYGRVCETQVYKLRSMVVLLFFNQEFVTTRIIFSNWHCFYLIVFLETIEQKVKITKYVLFNHLRKRKMVLPASRILCTSVQVSWSYDGEGRITNLEAARGWSSIKPWEAHVMRKSLSYHFLHQIVSTSR